MQASGKRRDARNALAEIARGQGGYFTLKQAQASGYDRQHLLYHTKTGTFERAGRGVYRLTLLPQHQQDELIRATLWSRDRSDTPQGVISHGTALVLHDLSDWIAEKIDLTVPPGFRRKPPKGCVLHRSSLDRSEFEQRDGYCVTKPLRTILDCLRDRSVSHHELTKAIGQAIERGLVRKRQLDAEAKSTPALLPLLKNGRV